jgi:hypothetical protein
MALLTISKAISSGIQRNVAVSELKHEAKLADIKLTLASNAITRMDTHAKRLTEARIGHATWLAGLSPAEAACFEQSKADLEAAITPATASE